MSPTDLPRIVFDTNALISAAILPNSVSRQALLHIPSRYQLVHSIETWWELTSVIQRSKFDRYFPSEGRAEFLMLLARISKFVEVSTVVTDCPDPKDNKFLALACDAHAPLIVSGDGHLRNMHPYRGIDIVAPAALLRLANG